MSDAAIAMIKIGDLPLIALDTLPADLRKAWHQAQSRLEIATDAEKQNLNAATYAAKKAARTEMVQVTDQVKVRMASTLLLKAAPRIGLRWPVATQQMEK